MEITYVLDNSENYKSLIDKLKDENNRDQQGLLYTDKFKLTERENEDKYIENAKKIMDLNINNTCFYSTIRLDSLDFYNYKEYFLSNNLLTKKIIKTFALGIPILDFSCYHHNIEDCQTISHLVYDFVPKYISLINDIVFEMNYILKRKYKIVCSREHINSIILSFPKTKTDKYFWIFSITYFFTKKNYITYTLKHNNFDINIEIFRTKGGGLSKKVEALQHFPKFQELVYAIDNTFIPKQPVKSAMNK